MLGKNTGLYRFCCVGADCYGLPEEFELTTPSSQRGEEERIHRFGCTNGERFDSAHGPTEARSHQSPRRDRAG